MEGMVVLYHGNESFRQKLVDAFASLGMDGVMGNLTVTRFPDNEFKPRSEANLRKKSVFVISSFTGYDGNFDPNIGLMELLIIIDMAKRASASEIVAVLPYYAYGRQDRKDESRVPVSAKLVMGLLKEAGATSVLVFEPHSPQIQSFGDIPVDRLSSDPLFGEHIFRNKEMGKWTYLAPDVGAMRTLRDFKNNIDSSFGMDLRLAMVEKKRTSNGVETKYLVGDICDNVIIKDDMISSGETIEKAAIKAKEKGAKRIWACATHGLFTQKNGLTALDRLKRSGIEKVIITDSIPGEWPDWIEIVSCAPLLASACVRIYNGESLSKLFAVE